jgi:hypothetical protein
LQQPQVLVSMESNRETDTELNKKIVCT